jgi:hypothetical protein
VRRRTGRHAPISTPELQRLGWRRVDGGNGKCSALWRHRSGWHIQHCGHPTANYPWALYDPAGRLILTGAAGVHRDPELGTAWESIRAASEYVRTVLQA